MGSERESAAAEAGESLEYLSKSVPVIVGNGYSFSTDTILLAWYSLPKAGEICADLGTGCGTIPLFWCARARPGTVWAVEIQSAACRMVRRSVRLCGLECMVRVVESDVRALRGTGPDPGSCDTVACNPPYTAAGAGVPSAKERGRLARHEIGGTLSDFAGAAALLLRWGGRFFCCMRPERLCETMLVLHKAGLEPKRLRLVQQRAGCAPFLFLLQSNRGGRPGMSVEPALLMERADGSLSEEMVRIYGDYKEGHL